MFQVKYLKPLSILRVRSGYELSSTLTVANDLGEQFFYGDVPISIDVRVHNTRDIINFKTIKTDDIHWSAGKRSLNFKILIGSKDVKAGEYVSVYSYIKDVSDVKDALNYDPISIEELIESTVDLKTFLKTSHITTHSLNDLKFYPSSSTLLQIQPNFETNTVIKTDRISIRTVTNIKLYEELSGDIARHIWDAGILFIESDITKLIDIGKIDDEIKILELGTGIGLASIHLSKIFPKSSILATDLDDAREICQSNIELNNRTDFVKFKELDWEVEKKETEEDWDLIIVTDCTYNPTYYDALLKVLQRESNIQTRIILVHKFREPISECEFFIKVQNNFILERQKWVGVRQELIHFGVYRLKRG